MLCISALVGEARSARTRLHLTSLRTYLDGLDGVDLATIHVPHLISSVCISRCLFIPMYILFCVSQIYLLTTTATAALSLR